MALISKENIIAMNQSLLKTDKIILFFYILYYVFNPIYLWRSGLPQVADIFLLLSLLVYFVKNKFVIKYNSRNKWFLLSVMLFVLWIVIVNLFWILKLQTYERFLISTFFYVYNLIVALYTIQLAAIYKSVLYKSTFYAVIISLLLEFVLYYTIGGFEGSRAVGTFNNPNQLGYYSILMISFLVFLSDKITIEYIWILLAAIAAIILSLASLSKAAILSLAGIIICFVLSKNKNKKLKQKIILFSLLISIFFGWLYFTTDYLQQNQLLISVQNRIESIGKDNDDSLEGRGYDRIYNYPEFWLFGAGEGEYTRFNPRSMEFHSTLGNIQLSYGIIGSLLFYCIIGSSLMKDRFRSWYIILFILVYGLTHNGIRSSLFWILLALISESSTINKVTIKIKRGSSLAKDT